MGINVNTVSANYDFEIHAASYVGKPKDNTVMFISKKVEQLLENLDGTKHCLVFAEEGIEVPEALMRDNCFVLTDDPRREYALFVDGLDRARKERDRQRKYTLTEGGYYIGENVTIGEGAEIEPLCFIGHDVVIGRNAVLKAGAKIKNAVIGDNFMAGENAVVGTLGFTMAADEQGNVIRVPSLGKVVIGNGVEIGAGAVIEVGTGGDTVLEDYVKLDALGGLGHDSHTGKNAEITSGVNVGGFVELGERVYIGMNATLRNRISVGENAKIGMGAIVASDVPDNSTAAGKPAKAFPNW